MPYWAQMFAKQQTGMARGGYDYCPPKHNSREIYFSPDILEVMDKIVTSNMEPKTKVAVPVFSLSDAVQ